MKEIKGSLDTGWLTLIASLFAIHYGSFIGGFVGTFLEVAGWIYVGLFLLVITIAVVLGLSVLVLSLLGLLFGGLVKLFKPKPIPTPEEYIKTVYKTKKKTSKRRGK